MKLWLAALLVPIGSLVLHGQSSLDSLDQDLNQLQQERSQHMTQALSDFLSALDKASSSPDAAVDLYKAAGGELPKPAKVESHYAVETPTERAAREATDDANMAVFASMVQAHCGMMRFAALYATDPDHPNLDQDWAAWIKATAAQYPQWVQTRKLMRESMQDSPISSYLGFAGWGDKDSGHWKLSDLPQLYYDKVLEPLHTALSPDVLPAWDTYIAMRHADQSDDNTWNKVDYPKLMFNRDCDAFALQPSTDALAPLVQIIKDNPTHADGDSWLKTVKDMVATLRGSAPGAAAPAPAPAAGTAASPSQEVMAQELPMTNAAPAPSPKAGP